MVTFAKTNKDMEKVSEIAALTRFIVSNIIGEDVSSNVYFIGAVVVGVVPNG